ncbi:hypothetical protein Tco_1295044 [Tanacetum coccineum]
MSYSPFLMIGIFIVVMVGGGESCSAILLGKPQQDDTGFVDSGCSRHMTRNIDYLLSFKEFDGGYVTFGGGAHGGRISGKNSLLVKLFVLLDDHVLPKLSQLLSKSQTLEALLEGRILMSIFKAWMEGYELGDRMEKAATTASSLEAKQDSGSGPRFQDTILGDVDAQTRFETTSKQSNDPPLSRGYILKSGEDTKAKTVNGEPQIQALIDKKKVIIMETSIRSDLHLEDAGVFINQQLGDMSHHKKIYVNPSHTNKIFANMKTEGKDFSGRITPLFATMMVQPNQEEGVDSGIPTDYQQTPITTQPSSYRSHKKQSRRKQRKDIAVLDLENVMDAQAKEIANLKKEGSKKDKDSLGDHEDASKRGGVLKDIDKDGDCLLVQRNERDILVLKIMIAPTTIELLMMKTLLGEIFKDQLEAELIEEERIAKKKEEEANITLIESWDNTQAMMEADFKLAQKLQTKEQGDSYNFKE